MLEELLNDHRMYHDETQIGFILGGRTKWGRYKQSIRELYKRIRGLRQEYCSRERLQIEIDRLVNKECNDEYERRLRDVELKEKSGCMEEINRSIANTKREAERFYREAAILKREFGEISEEKRKELDLEDWQHTLIKRGAFEMITTGRPNENTLKNIASLPLENRNYARMIISNSQNINNFLDNEVLDLTPSKEQLESVDVPALDYNEGEQK